MRSALRVTRFRLVLDHRIVGAELLDHAAVARLAMINGDNAKIGPVFPAHELHSNSDGHGLLLDGVGCDSQTFNVGEERMGGNRWLCGYEIQDRRKSRRRWIPGRFLRGLNPIQTIISRTLMRTCSEPTKVMSSCSRIGRRFKIEGI